MKISFSELLTMEICGATQMTNYYWSDSFLCGVCLDTQVTKWFFQRKLSLMGRHISYLTFVPSQTGCHMKNLLRQEAPRNKQFSSVAHRGLGKVSGTSTCHGCTVLTNISRC